MEQAVLVKTYMGGRPYVQVQEEEPKATEETPSGQDTSAKESVGDSPRVALRGKKCKHSSERSAQHEKMVVTTETMEEGEGMGEPVFQAKRKDIVKGKDIGNRASRAKKKTTETVQAKPISKQEQLSTVFPGGPKEGSGSKTTFATSMYKCFKEEQKQLQKDATDPSCSGKGRGKGGAHKRKGKSVQKKKAGPLPLEGWEDPEVVHALAGAKREVFAA